LWLRPVADSPHHLYRDEPFTALARKNWAARFGDELWRIHCIGAGSIRRKKEEDHLQTNNGHRNRVIRRFLIFSWSIIGFTACDQMERLRQQMTVQKTRAPHAVETSQPQASQSAPVVRSEGTNILKEISSGVAELAHATRPAVVFVSVSKSEDQSTAGSGAPDLPPELRDFFERFFNAPRPRSPGERPIPPPTLQGVGSGFFVNLTRGLIVTNNHVVEGAQSISVKLANGSVSEARIVGRDQNTDLAVLELTAQGINRDGLAELKFGNSDEVRVGDFSLALGAPFGLEASLSFGVISAVGRGSLGITQLGDFMQTDAAINPGNSGGPLLDVDGRVVGVNTAIFSQSGAYAGIGFAIPSNMARQVTDQLAANGKIERGFLGVSFQPLTPELRQGLKISDQVQGALVANVQANGPASKSGIQPGDVILSVNDDPLDKESELANRVGLMRPGTEVRLGILRKGREQTLSVTLGEYPVEPLASSPLQENPLAPGAGSDFGLGLQELTPQNKLAGTTSERGAVVAQVKPRSPAETAGLQEGDVIVGVDLQAVSTAKEAYKALEASENPVLRVERTGDFFFTTIRRQTGEAAESD
jgi:serine protease Do